MKGSFGILLGFGKGFGVWTTDVYNSHEGFLQRLRGGFIWLRWGTREGVLGFAACGMWALRSRCLGKKMGRPVQEGLECVLTFPL